MKERSNPGPRADDDVRMLDPTTEPARVGAMFVRGDRTQRGFGYRSSFAVSRIGRNGSLSGLIPRSI
jgi:hypothetical protein